jgi:hypothetical protein
MLLTISFLMIALGQDISTGSDLYPPTISTTSYIYACYKNNYEIHLQVRDVSNPEVSSLIIGNSYQSDTNYLDFHSKIASYRSISSWNASCITNTNDLILFVRGVRQSDSIETEDENTLTIFKITKDVKIEIQSD